MQTQSTPPTVALDRFLAETPDAPQLLFPNLLLFLQSNPNDRGSRTNLDQDACFQPVRQLICTLLSHLVASERAWVHLHLILFDIYDSDPAAKDALVNRLGGDRPLRRDDFTDYLRHHTPTVVLKDLRDGEKMSWGVVAKGDEPGAEGNELYLSLELTEAFIQAPPPELSPEDAENQQTRHKFLFSTPSSTHASTPSPSTSSPPNSQSLNSCSSCSMPATNTATRETHSNAGFSEDILCQDRMWRIHRLVAHHITFRNRSCMLPIADILRVQASFGKTKLFMLDGDDLPAFPTSINEGEYVRYRGAGVSSRLPVEDAPEEEDPYGGPAFVRVPMCGRGVLNSK
ncbi:hypothetical protein DFH06DRAFT_1220027 [Mycena polygramma]|nr:hypothetical protein DFH06DRAFT_1220027 [Mycena polygramma]